jgi:hypothetical protein
MSTSMLTKQPARPQAQCKKAPQNDDCAGSVVVQSPGEGLGAHRQPPQFLPGAPFVGLTQAGLRIRTAAFSKCVAADRSLRSFMSITTAAAGPTSPCKCPDMPGPATVNERGLLTAKAGGWAIHVHVKRLPNALRDSQSGPPRGYVCCFCTVSHGLEIGLIEDMFCPILIGHWKSKFVQARVRPSLVSRRRWGLGSEELFELFRLAGQASLTIKVAGQSDDLLRPRMIEAERRLIDVDGLLQRGFQQKP